MASSVTSAFGPLQKVDLHFRIWRNRDHAVVESSYADDPLITSSVERADIHTIFWVHLKELLKEPASEPGNFRRYKLL